MHCTGFYAEILHAHVSMQTLLVDFSQLNKAQFFSPVQSDLRAREHHCVLQSLECLSPEFTEKTLLSTETRALKPFHTSCFLARAVFRIAHRSLPCLCVSSQEPHSGAAVHLA